MHAEHTREVGVLHWRAIYSYYIIVYILIHICVHLDTLNINLYIHSELPHENIDTKLRQKSVDAAFSPDHAF